MKCIPIKNGIICISKTDFKCPKCECPHTEDDYYSRIEKSKTGLIYKKCKGCKSMLGITSDVRGDIHAWLKSEEKNQIVINH